MADSCLRQIKIKTGVVKRLVKEKVMYEKEAKQQEEKIEKMKAEDGENYAIKKQVKQHSGTDVVFATALREGPFSVVCEAEAGWPLQVSMH